MSATTLWKDMETDDFESVINRMSETIPDDERNSSVYIMNFTNRKLSSNNKTFEVNGTTAIYNVFKYSYVTVCPQNGPNEDRISPKNGFIVVVGINGAIYYIVDQNSQAKRLLRKLLGYTGRNEIIGSNFDFKQDFFVWLVNRVYNSDGVIENGLADDVKEMCLEEIKGICGDTEDLQTKVSTSGESVMNVISTLSFLLESRLLNQVRLNMRYTGHDNISIKLNKNTVEIERPYIGDFLDEDSHEEILGKVYILLYFEILPLLETEYRMNKNDDLWNQEAYIKFLKSIKDTVIEKIETKICSIT